MTLEECITDMEQRYGKDRGVQAQPGHPNYEAAREINFKICECSKRDPTFIGPPEAGGAYFDYIGRSRDGKVFAVGCVRLVTVGPKHYHTHRPNVPLCV